MVDLVSYWFDVMVDEKIPRPKAPVHLYECVVFTHRNLIVRNGKETGVEPKVMDVLCVLIDCRDDVLSREELIERVWGEPAGADERLTRAISQLRKALGDTPRSPKFIETVPKRGYRLVSPVAFEMEDRPAQESAQPPQPPLPIRRRVVLAAALLALAGLIVIGAFWLF